MAVAQTAQELVVSNETVYDALASFMQSLKSKQSVEKVLPSMKPAWWKAFCQSSYGVGLLRDHSIDCELYDVGVWPPRVVPEVRVPEANLTVRKACACGWVPVSDAPLIDGRCYTCHAEYLARKQAPVPVPVPVPQPETTNQKPQMTSADQSLMALIAQGLTQVGFTPQHAVSAEECKSIAESAALDVAELVREQLKAEGLGVSRSVIVIKEGEVSRQVSGHAPTWFPRLRKLAACRVPALLVGPPGSGKTTAFKLLAESMGLPFHRVSIAAGTDEGQLQGWLHPVGDHMRFEYVASVVSTAYEQGGVVLIDDIDLGDPNALGILNAALDSGGWHIPLRYNDPVLRKHADCYIGGASNTWGHGADRRHSGANQLDERTLSRFRLGQIWCDYDSALETELFDRRVVNTGHMIRARIAALSGSARYLSTRDIESAHRLLAQFDPDEAWYGYFADWSKEELRSCHVGRDQTAMTAWLE